MARIIYRHALRVKGEVQIYTDLDFWDARKLLKDLAVVKRNFGRTPPGDQYPTQIAAHDLSDSTRKRIQKRLKRSIASPPRHVVVRSMLARGLFEFDPFQYYPERWSRSRMLHFTFHRLPLEQPALSNVYQTVRLFWLRDRICVERVQRGKRHDPVIRSRTDARRRLVVPGCF